MALACGWQWLALMLVQFLSGACFGVVDRGYGCCLHHIQQMMMKIMMTAPVHSGAGLSRMHGAETA
jgi:hypothetical protein